MVPDHRLLLISCSKKKKPETGLVPAIERYDGPRFRVLRKFLRDHEPAVEFLDIRILSAEFGIIHANHRIPNYDRVMNAQRATELRPVILAELKSLVQNKRYKQILISAGKYYLCALDGYSKLLTPDIQVTISRGAHGRRLAELRNWLYADMTIQPQNEVALARRSTPRIRGIEVSLTSEQVLEVARNALLAGLGNPTHYESWYVLIDNQRIAPKWLVSQLTGLPVNAFGTDEARRLLAQLGVEVWRV